VKPENGGIARDEITLTGTFNNWSGDESFAVGMNPRPGAGGLGGTIGGLAGETAGNEYGAPWDVEDDNDVPLLKGFAGTILRVFYWNAVGRIGSGVAAAPAFSPKAGTKPEAVEVTITSDPGATIFYTMDGTAPSGSSPSGASPLTLTVPSSLALKAYASRPGYANSAVETAEYVIERPVLKHRYSFDGAAGSTLITDSVSAANGTLINGSAEATLGGGKLVLDGNFSSAYVELPAGIISKLTNATFKTWVTWDGGNPWQRIWDFGTNSGVGQNVIAAYLTPRGGPNGVLRFGFNFVGEQDADAITQLVTSNEVCLTVTYNYAEETGTIYVGARKVASARISKALFDVPDIYNWLGRAKYNDPFFAGSYNEFRIYSGAESDLQVAVSAAAGPDRVVANPGALESLVVTAATDTIDAQSAGIPLQVLATFANITGVDVTVLEKTSVSSSDASVADILDGKIIPKHVGTTTISASYGGKSGSFVVKVTDSAPWPTLRHRYSFSDTQGTVVADSVGNLDGTFHGAGTFTGTRLVLPENNPRPLADGTPDPAGGWVSFPAGQGIVSGLPNKASIECWVYWRGGAIWQEIYDFGAGATPGYSLGGGTYMMLCPRDNIGKMRVQWFPVAGGFILLTPPLEPGTVSHIVLTHDQDLQLDKLYHNGKLVGSGTNTVLFSSLPDMDNWLARDQWRDPMFNGAYDEFRIWNGALTAGQVENLYNAGPDVVAGPPLGIVPSSASVMLRWPANASGFQLEWTSNLNAGPWNNVPNAPAVADGFNTVTLGWEATPRYYRLKQ
jgi:ligand-binding SRPBCC domain-containing protein